MRHIMMDLETYGTTPGCGIVSIGAVEFFPTAAKHEQLGDSFYVVINRDSCETAFLFEEEGTIAWWGRQSADARIAFDVATRGEGKDLREALMEFSAFTGNKRDTRIYGNGADFDNPILSSAHHAVQLKIPCTYGGRCYRTLKSLDELFGGLYVAPKLVREGAYHNALDDAKSQALHLCDIVSQIIGE